MIVKIQRRKIIRGSKTLFFIIYSRINSGMDREEIKLEEIPIGRKGIKNKTKKAIGRFCRWMIFRHFFKEKWIAVVIFIFCFW